MPGAENDAAPLEPPVAEAVPEDVPVREAEPEPEPEPDCVAEGPVVVAPEALPEALALPDALAARPLPIELVDVHEEVGGAGCAAGVLGSPWWKVEVP